MRFMDRRDLIRGGLGAAVGLAGIGRSRSAAEGTGESAGKPPPNLLFIMTDQQRWDALSRAGNKVLETPNLDRLAREGAYFQNAVTCCPVCVPARVSMLTGCSLETTGVRTNNDKDREDVCTMPTFDNILASRGYWTEYFGKWHAPIHRAMDYKNKVTQAGVRETVLGPGLSVHYQQYLDKHVPGRKPRQGERLDRYSRRPYIPDPLDIGYGLGPNELPRDRKGQPIRRYSQADCYGRLLIPAKHQPTAMNADETIDALERLKDRPSSITCSIHHPHPPMILPEPYYGMYPAKAMPIPASIGDPMDNSPYTAAARRAPKYRDKSLIGYMISNYYGLVREIDDHVGRILRTLKALGRENNTLVVFTSDHGEMLGSHGMHGKSNFYEEAVHIPLMMRMPGVIPAGTVVSEPVSQMNLFATILDYLGAAEQPSQGRSLRGLIDGKNKNGFEYAVSEWAPANVPNFMVRTKTRKFMFARSADSKALDALYNLDDDPLEMNNLLGRNPERARWIKTANAMKDRLVAWLERTQSPFVDGVKQRKIS